MSIFAPEIREMRRLLRSHDEADGRAFVEMAAMLRATLYVIGDDPASVPLNQLAGEFAAREIRKLHAPSNHVIYAILHRCLGLNETNSVLERYAIKASLDVPFVPNQEHYYQLLRTEAIWHLTANLRILRGVIRTR